MRRGFFWIIAIAVFVCSVGFVRTAYAYIDPGTGSYIFQILIVGVIGGLCAVKIFWAKIVLFVKRLFPGKRP
ncbi:MAG: hypothetical protein PHS88_06495 [Candidatus Omnitrophica bacterium]|nr:hypothetical protein [Candidatus Omnitrophota bacterium]